MINKKYVILVALVLGLCLCLVAACGKKQQPKVIHMAAAASLEKIMEQELLPAFTKESGYQVQATYDGSGRLQLQIEQGMATDLFISASSKQVKALEAKGYIKSSQPLLENTLVLITPKNNNTVKDFADLPKVDHVALGDPATVPVGQYSQRLLTKLGLWDQVAPRASLATSVTQVLQWTVAGSAEAGLVYSTDARKNQQVQIVKEVPGDLLPPALYPLALLKGAREPEGAQALAKYLQSREAGKAFAAYGFKPVGGAQ